MDKDIIDILKKTAQRLNIHSCCLLCERHYILLCKASYSHWSGTMPCTEFCEDFVESHVWKTVFEILDEEGETN